MCIKERRQPSEHKDKRRKRGGDGEEGKQPSARRGETGRMDDDDVVNGWKEMIEKRDRKSKEK